VASVNSLFLPRNRSSALINSRGNFMGKVVWIVANEFGSNCKVYICCNLFKLIFNFHMKYYHK
jgi:hypothetical protein